MRLLVPVSRVTTAWTRLPDVVSTVRDDLGLRQVCGRRDPFAWVGAVLSWTAHRVALLAQMLGPEIYDKCLLGATRLPRYSLSFCHAADAVIWRERRRQVFRLTRRGHQLFAPAS